MRFVLYYYCYYCYTVSQKSTMSLFDSRCAKDNIYGSVIMAGAYTTRVHRLP